MDEFDPGSGLAPRPKHTEGGDVGHAFEVEPEGALRDTPPDVLTPIDARAPVSGHRPMWDAPTALASAAPEHDFVAASALIVPALRPIGTQGRPISELLAGRVDISSTSHPQPLIDEGPCGLPVVYTIAAEGFAVVVNGDHLASWGVPISAIQDAAIANLRAWSATAGWSEETSGDRRLISSDTGGGSDATRILLPEVREYLVRELGGGGRVLVGLPDRDLLLAGALRPGDEEFGVLFGEFVVEHSGGADEPIDRRVFEIVDGQLVEFAG